MRARCISAECGENFLNQDPVMMVYNLFGQILGRRICTTGVEFLVKEFPVLEERAQSLLRRVVPSVVLLAIMLMACVTHANRYLYLSGDEIFFYFLGMKDNWSDYRPHYEKIRDQIGKEQQEPYFQNLSGAQLDNFRGAEFYLGIEPQFFAEYRLPRLLWGLVGATVAPSSRLALSDEALSEGLADSVFFMFMAGYLIVCVLVAAITYRLTGYAKAALIVFVLLTFFKESFVDLNADLFYRTFPDLTAAFLSAAISPGKDFMAFSFSGRSLFLLLLVAYLACRWDRPYRMNAGSYAPYLMLPAFTLVHASQGILVTGIFFVIDGIMWRPRLKSPLVLLSYAASFALALDGGMAGKLWSFAGLSLLTVLLLIAGASVAQTATHEPAIPLQMDVDGPKSVRSTWRREGLLSGALVLTFLVLGRPITQGLGIQDNFLLMTLAGRGGSIFGVELLFMLSWFGVELVARALKISVGPSLIKTGSAVLIAPVILAGVVARTEDLSFDLAGVRTRLRIESSDYLAGAAAPLSFKYNNELHLIWYSIIKSALHNKNFPVTMQLHD
jgi:hypothetical protein